MFVVSLLAVSLMLVGFTDSFLVSLRGSRGTSRCYFDGPTTSGSSSSFTR